MTITLVPALALQRAIYRLPRGPERFDAYTTTMLDDEGRIALPLGLFNPMARESVASALDTLIDAGAEAVAAETLAAALADLGDKAPTDAGLCLVVVDDVGGSWTERGFNELQHLAGALAELERGWLTVLLWTSEEWLADRLRAAVRRSVYRLAWQQRHGAPLSVGDLLRQEGPAARFALADEPRLDATARAAIAAVIDAHRDATDMATRYVCLFGDEAADRVGYAALGLPARAGFALAWAEADGIEPAL